jgi:hypothetical protein
MTTQRLMPLTLAGFEAAVVATAGNLELSLRGNADMTVSLAFGRYLKDVDAEARRDSVHVVKVRLGELYFLSSSCLQAIAAWLLSVAARDPEGRYTVTFETHAAHGWQRRSLEAIRRIVPDIVAVL